MPVLQKQAYGPVVEEGLLERVVLAAIFVRPFRCEECDSRFLRWPIGEKPAVRPIRTSWAFAIRSGLRW